MASEPAAKRLRTSPIAVGDEIDDVTIHEGFPPNSVSMKSRLAGKKVVLVGLPGAFTPT